MMSRLEKAFKETELGWIPEEWDISNLENLTTKITDGAHHSPPTFDGGYPIATVENMEHSSINVSACRTISSEDFELLKKNSCSPEYGDVLLSKDGTIGKTLVYKQKDEIVLLSSIAIIRNNKNALLPQYLMFFFQSPYFYWNLERLRSGSAIKRIVLKDIKRVLLPIPSLKEQQKIASILSSVDEAIEKTKAIIEQTKKVKKGLMQRLFTKGIGHTKFKKTEIGEIPDEWDVLALNDVLNFVGSGITPKGGSAVYQSEGIPFIRSQNVYPDGLRIDDIAFISDAIHEKMNRSKVQEHDVLLNITGASIGRCTYVPKGFGEANVNQHVCILRSNEKIYYKYLAYFMNSSLGQRQIFLEQAGQTREGLNYQQIRAFSITVPSMIEQEKIANIINNFNQKVNNERKKLDTLQYLKKGLMQSLLTGKVRVKVDKAEVTQV